MFARLRSGQRGSTQFTVCETVGEERDSARWLTTVREVVEEVRDVVEEGAQI